MEGFSYIPGDGSERPLPLGRYLPSIPGGVASAFLAQHVKLEGTDQGTWVLDPFGASPTMEIEMARLNYCVLVAVNNPVSHFLLEMVANPPSRSDLRAALADLAAARKGEDRLENLLQSLYITECNRCQQQVPADAFIWERSTGELVGRLYHCHCGDSGEYPATEADKKRAAGFAATDGLHRSRALERVASRDDPDRQHTEEALLCYLPRAVYALLTIINKLDSLSLPPGHRRALIALLLSACDETSSLWPHPGDRPRPKQLTVPAHFLEKNIWMALENGIDLWAGGGKPVQVVNWPEVPGASGGLCLFEGPVRDLAPHLKDLSIGAVITALPRPNQAFWTLSTLWAGWLWGREAAAPFKSVVRRRRYDWNWHASALFAALKNISEKIPLNAPLFTLVSEVEPPFLSAALLAAAGSGFDLNGLALRTRHDPVEIVWYRRAFSHERQEQAGINPSNVEEALQLTLKDRGEPVPYIYLHAAGLSAMAYDHSLQWQEDALNLAQAPIQAALTHSEFVHLSESSNPEVGLWGLSDWDSASDPLPDRLEVAVVQLLQKNPGCTAREIETALNHSFSGLLTPSWGLLNAVLFSYASKEGELWNLRPEDTPSLRRADLESAGQSLVMLGDRLGFAVQREESPCRIILWKENGEVRFAFHLIASAVVGHILRQNKPSPSSRNFIVLPGGRASLLSYKLDRDPTLAVLARDWRIFKFRHLRRMAEISSLTLALFEKNLSADPIEPPEQMKLF
jgi:hypothetical protein